jgi:lysophospholipase L1-like esterase
MGVLFPIRDEFILDAGEILVLRDKISAYNVIIKSIAAQYNLAVVEADKFVNKLSDGFIYNGVTMSAKFVSGGAYSLDGIHFNPKGNALLANEFIKSINSKYKSTIPLVNVGKFNATFFP